MSQVLAIIEDEQIVYNDNGTITFKSKAAVDTDGIGPLHGDPCAQTETSLKLNGKSLNADEDIYIVVPPAIVHFVAPIVLGCKAYVTCSATGKTTYAVVGDIGPRKKLGEISVACAKALGINPSPTAGGIDAHVVHYTLWPGEPAIVDGKKYNLQPA